MRWIPEHVRNDGIYFAPRAALLPVSYAAIVGALPPTRYAAGNRIRPDHSDVYLQERRPRRDIRELLRTHVTGNYRQPYSTFTHEFFCLLNPGFSLDPSGE